MKFYVKSTPQDFARFNAEYCWRWPRLWSAAGLFITAFVAACIFLFAVSLFEIAAGFDVPVFFELPAMMILMFSVIRMYQSFMLRFTQRDAELLFEPTTYEIAEDGMRINSATYESLFRWNAFKEIIVTRRAAYLGIGASRALIFPRSCFPSEEEFRAFIELCRQATGLKVSGKV